jgi:hypothetical protein
MAAAIFEFDSALDWLAGNGWHPPGQADATAVIERALNARFLDLHLRSALRACSPWS